jgi:hypothetical protein
MYLCNLQTNGCLKIHRKYINAFKDIAKAIASQGIKRKSQKTHQKHIGCQI